MGALEFSVLHRRALDIFKSNQRMLPDPGAWIDGANDAMTRQLAGEFDGYTGSIAAWSWKLKHLVADFARAERGQVSQAQESDAPLDAVTLESEAAPSALIATVQRMAASGLDDVASQLPELGMLLMLNQGHTLAQAAQAHDIPVASARRRVTAAQDSIRQALTNSIGFWLDA